MKSTFVVTATLIGLTFGPPSPGRAQARAKQPAKAAASKGVTAPKIDLSK